MKVAGRTPDPETVPGKMDLHAKSRLLGFCQVTQRWDRAAGEASVGAARIVRV